MRTEDQLDMIYVLYKEHTVEILIFWDMVMYHWVTAVLKECEVMC